MCGSQCVPPLQPCGAGACTTSSAQCAITIIDMSFSTAMMMTSTAATIMSLGAASAVTAPTNAAVTALRQGAKRALVTSQTVLSKAYVRQLVIKRVKAQTAKQFSKK